jgi:betaine-aldehyde dehydrogenase
MAWNRGIAARLTRMFPEVLHVDPPALDADLFENGVIDSLAFVELLMKLEQEFGVSVAVDDLELDNFRTIERIAAFVEARTTAPPLRLVRQSTGR